MKLHDIFEQLSVGEFSQLSFGGQDAGVINSSNWEKLLPHIALGLTTLYTRFHLRENRVTLALIPGKESYKLDSNYSIHSNVVAAPARYIQDTVDARFLDDVLKVQQVLTDDGTELGLNDPANAYSVRTPSALELRVPKIMVTSGADTPDEMKTETLTVVYRANHPRMSRRVAVCEPLKVDVELPDTHLSALLFYVASRVHNPIGMTNEFHAGNSYYAKYEQACADLENQGMQVNQDSTNHRLERNGWA